jgi:hypothetical protein
VAACEETEEAGPYAERVAALDIGKAGLVACLRVPAETRAGRRRQEVTEWTTMTEDLTALADHLVCQGVELVVMEATGVIRRSGDRRWCLRRWNACGRVRDRSGRAAVIHNPTDHLRATPACRPCGARKKTQGGKKISAWRRHSPPSPAVVDSPG